MAALLLFPTLLSARTVPWTFRADFARGFNGWMSYPLPQDIGFDPTLTVEPLPSGPALIRAITSVGQASLSLGVIRPLHFLANAGTRIAIQYTAAWPAPDPTLELLLAAENGHRYRAPLPAAGQRDILLTGADLHLPATDIPIEAVVIIGSAAQPAPGSLNRLVLSAFALDTARPAEVEVRAPPLIPDPDRRRVAGIVTPAATGLTLQLEPGTSPVRVILQDAEDRTRVERTLPAGRHTIALGPNPQPGLWRARLESPQAGGEFSFLVLGTLPPHPRVLLSAERLRQLRSPAFAALRQQVHERARAESSRLPDATAAGNEIAHLPPGRSLRPSFDGELTHYLDWVESWSNATAFCALDYALSGDAASLETARRQLLAVSRWPTWTPPRLTAHGMHTYYDTGVLAQGLAFTYDLIAANLSPAEKQEIADAFRTKCIDQTVDEYYRYNRMPTAASNWMSNSLGGALAAAVAVAGDVPGWQDREGVALAQLLAAFEQNVQGLFPGDGSEAEPAGYEQFAMEGLSWGAAALRSLGIQPRGLGRMLEGFRWPAYATVRPDLVLDTGDFGGRFRSLAGFAFGAEFGGIPALRQFYDRLQKPRPELLDLLCCTHPLAPSGGPDSHAALRAPGPDPPSRIFPKRGSAVLRSGWTPDDTVISLRAGPWFNHEHHDQGSFQVAAFGTQLIAEAGYANYYNDPNYATYFSKAPGHNTVLLDDDAFSQSDYDGDFWQVLRRHPTFADQLLSRQSDYLEADLAPAYAHVERYRRQYLFLAPDILIVRDELSAAEPHVFTWLLHAPAGAAVDSQGRRASIAMAGAAADITAAGSPAEWQVRPAPVRTRSRNPTVHPDVLRLSSACAPRATFEVAMQFRKRTAGPAALQFTGAGNSSGFTGDAGAWALFRHAAGVLRFGDLAADASVFAGRDAGNWMAVGVHSVEQSGESLFTADPPANVACTRSAEEIQLDFQLAAPTSIAVAARAPVSAVAVDGAPVRYNFQGGRVRLSLPQGEHHVGIRTRADLR